MSRDIRAGGAFVEFFSKGKAGLMKDLAGVQAGLSALALAANAAAAVAAAAAAVGGAAIAGLAVSFKKFLDHSDKFSDMAARTGATTKRLQELDYAASQSGASIEDVERAMLTAQRKGLDFEKVAKVIGEIEDPMKRTQAAFEAFGKAGLKLGPMFAEMDKLAAKANLLGLVLGMEDTAKGGQLKDMLETITKQVNSLAAVIGSTLAPVMEVVFAKTQEILAQVIRAMQGVRDAIIASNIPLAFEIVWTASLLEFEKFRSQLLMSLAHLGQDMVKMAMQISKHFAKALWKGDIGGLADLAKMIQKPSRNIPELQKRLDALIDKAAVQRERMGYLLPSMPALPRFNIPTGLRVQSGQFGTFNAAIASMAGRTGQLTVEQKQLDALEDIDDKLGKIIEKGGLTFG